MRETFAARPQAKASCLVIDRWNGRIVELARAVKMAAGRSRTEFCCRVAKRREAVEKPRRSLERMEIDRDRKNGILRVRA
jgi:hypothetical protein